MLTFEDKCFQWASGFYLTEHIPDEWFDEDEYDEDDQNEYLKDVVYIFIATICYDLAASHDMLDMSMEDVENYQLAKELQHAKTKLTVIDGGKK